MVDRVKLILFHQPEQMWKLQRQDSLRLQKDLHAGNEITKIGNLGEDVVADQQIRRSPLRPSRQPTFPKKPDKGRNLLLFCNLRNIGGRLYAQHRNAFSTKYCNKYPSLLATSITRLRPFRSNRPSMCSV